jgi:hypothetical protein
MTDENRSPTEDQPPEANQPKAPRQAADDDQESPEWLRRLAEDGDPDAGAPPPGPGDDGTEEEPPIPQDDQEEDLSDWLWDDIQDDMPGAKDQLPEWLLALDATLQEEEQGQEPEPDRLGEAEAALAGAASVAAGSTEQGSDLPDWLQEMSREVEAESEPEPPMAEEPPPPERATRPLQEGAPEPADEEEQEDSSGAAALALGAAAIAGAAGLAAGKTESEPGTEGPPTGDQEEVPGWLLAIESEMPGEPPEGELPPETDAEVELPEWLYEAEREAVPEQELLELPEDEGLEEGEALDWVEELRAEEEPEEPVEAEVETSGPLAGLAGLLSPEPLLGVAAQSTYQPAPAVPEDQIAEASALSELLSQVPSRPSVEVPPPGRKVMRSIGRWLVYLALVVMIIAGMFVSDLHDLVLSHRTADVQSFYNAVTDLPPESAVLLVVDYDASRDGELTPLTRAIVWHVFERGSRVVAVSHTPQGAAMVQDVLQAPELRPAGTAYAAGQAYLNLGYLPPHPASLQAFMAGPLDGAALWGDAEALPAEDGLGAQIGAFEDLDLIVIVSGNQQHTRWWIEQTATRAEGSREAPALITGISASIAPHLLPYAAAPGLGEGGAQVRGALVGLAGAAEYERMIGAQYSPNARQNMILQGSAQVLLAAIVLVSSFGLLLRSAMRKRS